MTGPLTLFSWNVNGARAVYKNGFMDWLAAADADIVCLQETRADEHQLPADLAAAGGVSRLLEPIAQQEGLQRHGHAHPRGAAERRDGTGDRGVRPGGADDHCRI